MDLDDFGTVARLVGRVVAFLLWGWLRAVFRYLWFRWLFGDPFEHPLADQGWRSVLRRGAVVGFWLFTTVAVCAGLAVLLTVTLS